MWNREPALIAGLVQALLALAIAFGLQLSPEQMAALVAATSAVLAVVVRRTVTPTHRVGAHMSALAEVA
jgi:hypothetical protein